MLSIAQRTVISRGNAAPAAVGVTGAVSSDPTPPLRTVRRTRSSPSRLRPMSQGAAVRQLASRSARDLAADRSPVAGTGRSARNSPAWGSEHDVAVQPSPTTSKHDLNSAGRAFMAAAPASDPL